MTPDGCLLSSLSHKLAAMDLVFGTCPSRMLLIAAIAFINLSLPKIIKAEWNGQLEDVSAQILGILRCRPN